MQSGMTMTEGMDTVPIEEAAVMHHLMEETMGTELYQIIGTTAGTALIMGMINPYQIRDLAEGAVLAMAEQKALLMAGIAAARLSHPTLPGLHAWPALPARFALPVCPTHLLARAPDERNEIQCLKSASTSYQ